METQELSAHLSAATEAVEPRPGFTDAVVRGGRRRQTRRRAGLATAAAVVIVLTGATTYAVINNDAATNEIMAGWLDGPTRGDLAGDQQFIAEATNAWETGKARSPNKSAGVFDDLRSAPHVYWAGNTEDGRTAIVVQQSYLHPHEQLPDGAANTLQTLVGLVATDQNDGRLKLVGDQFRAKPSDPLPGSFWFGRQDRTLIVVDTQQPVWTGSSDALVAGTAPSPRDGTFEQVPQVDGVALTTSERGRVATVLIGPDPHAVDAVDVPTYTASGYLFAVMVGETGPLAPVGTADLGWGENWVVTPDVDFAIDDPLEVYTRAVLGDPPEPRLVDNWTIRVRFAGGSAMFVGAVKDGFGQPWRGIVVVVNAQGECEWIFGTGSIDRDQPVPVIAPVYQDISGSGLVGWVVAAKGKQLSYRTTGGWIAAGTDVGLLPVDATQVKADNQVMDIK